MSFGPIMTRPSGFIIALRINQTDLPKDTFALRTFVRATLCTALDVDRSTTGARVLELQACHCHLMVHRLLSWLRCWMPLITGRADRSRGHVMSCRLFCWL